MKYSIDEMIDAVRQELSESNELIGKKKKLYDKDYFVIGVIRCAAQRLEQKPNEETVADSEILKPHDVIYHNGTQNTLGD